MFTNSAGSQAVQSQSVIRTAVPEVKKVPIETAEVQSNTNSANQVVKASQSNQSNQENNQSKEPNEKQVKTAVNEMNSKLKMTKTRCEFSLHEKTNRISIKIIDKDTDEVIREVPAEKTLEMIEKAWEIAGLLVDEKR